ncbi:hypothetical protein [Frankia sp. Cas4]|uniref:hypothetical protein n=1 Tax=Frankia sp. Cas4 TaxID=3073927 RepID=UPI002AD28AE5|nr:hypothetical protein [Frankia sp. Cas4]
MQQLDDGAAGVAGAFGDFDGAQARGPREAGGRAQAGGGVFGPGQGGFAARGNGREGR